MSHDQNFKNLILDYPRQALAFFAEEEAQAINASVRIMPVRQEQLKERLGDRFRELDIPLLVEWPDGRREAVVFVLEEETDPRRFKIHRLAHYCLDLSELIRTDQVVPVVIFLKRGRFPRELRLGGDRNEYLSFRYLSCVLADLPLSRYLDSDNIVARLNLPNMRYDKREDKIRAYAHAIRGLLELEGDPEKRIKYLDFIDIYAGLEETELEQYKHEYPTEAQAMVGFVERYRQEGLQEGLQKGLQEGLQKGLQEGLRKGLEEGLQKTLAAERKLLLRQIRKRFGSECAERAWPLLTKIEDQEQLADLAEWIIDARDGEEFLSRIQATQ